MVNVKFPAPRAYGFEIVHGRKRCPHGAAHEAQAINRKFTPNETNRILGKLAAAQTRGIYPRLIPHPAVARRSQTGVWHRFAS
jgi:hypothetical protein